MCTICISAHRSSSLRQSSLRQPASSPPQRRKKRGRDGSSGSQQQQQQQQAMCSRRVKRVSFSAREYVLGTAQDYDRTSYEVEIPRPSTAPADSDTTATATAAAEAEAAAAAAVAAASITGTAGTSPNPTRRDGRANFCGIWRRSHGFNWASLLEFSGVDKADIPEQAAKMQSSSVVHLIDHDEVSFRLVVHSDDTGTSSTPIQDQQFFIGGQPRPNPNSSNATSTLSNMRWDKNNQALVLKSVDAASGDEMTVSRHLASQGTIMVQHYRARSARSGDTAEAVTIFRRMAQGS